MKEHKVENDWLSLREAARQLGVHPTTLRRWADTGEIPVIITPGGHRRFTHADIERFSEQRRRLKVLPGLERIWAEQALTQTRQGLQTRQAEPWMAVADEQEREHKRLLGRRLMGLTLQYIALNDGGDELLLEAQAIGREHALSAIAGGMPLVEAIRAVLFFRDTLVEVAVQLPDMAHLRPEANVTLMRRINTLLNTVQLAIADSYDHV